SRKRAKNGTSFFFLTFMPDHLLGALPPSRHSACARSAVKRFLLSPQIVFSFVRSSKCGTSEPDVGALPCRTKFSLGLRSVPFFTLSFETLPKTVKSPTIFWVFLQIFTINAFSLARLLGVDQRRPQIMAERIKPVRRF